MNAASPVPPSLPATLHDVARLAGVSAKTVARAVNGEANVRPETRERVSRAAEALRFRPNRLARELRQGARTGAVGLVIGGLANPFYSQLAAGVDAALRERDLELVIASTDDEPDRERSVVHTMLERRVRALLMVPSAEDHSYLERERQEGMPVVFLDRPPVGLTADVVLGQDREGVAEAVRTLVAVGHRRIVALADSPRLYTARERMSAFREATSASGLLDSECPAVPDVHRSTAASAVVQELLGTAHAPTAIIGLNNRINVGVVDALLRSGSDCAFVGLDDFDLAAALGISVIANDPHQLGYRAGQLALARLADPSTPPQRIALESRLIRRGSGERPPAVRPDGGEHGAS